MLAVWIIGSALVVIVIAFGTIGSLSRTLATTESAAVYDIAEATDWVSERLPDPITARLSHDDVTAVLMWHLAFLREQGMATFGGADLRAMKAALRGEEVVADEEDAIDAIMAAAEASERAIETVDVVVISELNNQYLDAIGALGVRTEIHPH